jgi:hypothetical protein
MQCDTIPVGDRRRWSRPKRLVGATLGRSDTRRAGLSDVDSSEPRAGARWPRRLAGLAAAAGVVLAASCGQMSYSPLPKSRVVLADDFYRPSPAAGAKIPLSVAMVASPAFDSERFLATDSGRYYEIEVQPALSAGINRLLTDTFTSARVARGTSGVGSAQVEVHPAVNLGLSFSQDVFSEKITATATLYLVLTDARNGVQLGEFQREAVANGVGGAPWDMGGIVTGFRAGANNSAVIADLVGSALAADLSRLSDDLRQAALGERLARAQARPQPPPDEIVPRIPYIPNALEGPGAGS